MEAARLAEERRIPEKEERHLAEEAEKALNRAERESRLAEEAEEAGTSWKKESPPMNLKLDLVYVKTYPAP